MEVTGRYPVRETQLTNQQLYLSIGIPSLVVLIGILVNIGYFIVLNSRMGAIEGKLSSVAEQTAVHKTLLDIVLKKLDELEAKIHR